MKLLRIEVFYRAIKVPFMPIIVIINVTKRGIKRDLDRVLHVISRHERDACTCCTRDALLVS